MEPSAVRALLSAGILRQLDSTYVVVLDSRHAAFKELCALLKVLTGHKMGKIPAVPFSEPHHIAPNTPIGLVGYATFASLTTLLEYGAMPREKIIDYNRHIVLSSVAKSIQSLLKSGLFSKRGKKLSISPHVPKEYLAFVGAVWRHLAGTHRYFPAVRIPNRPPPAYGRAEDGAPRIFGSDIRLRSLMALAKHGPIHISDLRRLTGNSQSESDSNAPFGRGGVARTWTDGNVRAAMLDPAYPVAAPLRRYLLKMEELYPLPAFERVYPKPKPPKKEHWVGDRLALFGSPIPTSIFLAIAPLGWTYEALCVTLTTGYHRENVKKVIKRLEKEGVIEGDRPRKAGFNARIYRIAQECPAREELIDLLAACLKAWRQIEQTVLHAVKGLHPKTKEHAAPWDPASPSKGIQAPCSRSRPGWWCMNRLLL